jgi:hypothetical protein
VDPVLPIFLGRKNRVMIVRIMMRIVMNRAKSDIKGVNIPKSITWVVLGMGA